MEKSTKQNNPTSTKEIEFVVSKTKKTPGLYGFTCEFYQILKEQKLPILHNTFQKAEE